MKQPLTQQLADLVLPTFAVNDPLLLQVVAEDLGLCHLREALPVVAEDIGGVPVLQALNDVDAAILVTEDEIPREPGPTDRREARSEGLGKELQAVLGDWSGPLAHLVEHWFEPALQLRPRHLTRRQDLPVVTPGLDAQIRLQLLGQGRAASEEIEKEIDPVEERLLVLIGVGQCRRDNGFGADAASAIVNSTLGGSQKVRG